MKALAIGVILAMASAPALASNPLPTNLQVRHGDHVRSFYACTISINRLEPGDAGYSVLNVRHCQSNEETDVPGAPPWTLVAGVAYGNVYLPDASFRDCAMVHSQIIVTGDTVQQTIMLECQAAAIMVDGFEPG